uniref:Uncharacterized protein n=1 Tax=Heterorhabditis bacteriophora TaxID=37862 RepID=A0A1I7WNJ4_HETBA
MLSEIVPLRGRGEQEQSELLCYAKQHIDAKIMIEEKFAINKWELNWYWFRKVRSLAVKAESLFPHQSSSSVDILD